MDYQGGNIGRVFVLKMDHGDNILDEIETFANAESITSAFIFMLGALSEGNVVVGPEKNQMPPTPMWFRFSDAHEIIGVGNIFKENGKPRIHLHAALGRDGNTNTGCIREKNEAFMVTEILVLEVDGLEAERVHDEERGFSPICFRK
ncbi:putative DNA-binding protein with PD1-like motif [Methanohalophilus levihalophilus]|uniref:PPC domain-containing DNA-binding protein n=1 Tax=Methanohalophilus levihalophilus TaxID=1431282 RepID=UPI001AE9EFA8|nr:DUF296 domain-containing protein [Methanohalophilus levihalophilus]MBP2029873.1 putative DNA-binding protein with PD1-like motif [Methanohalophilus levihalophilus]